MKKTKVFLVSRNYNAKGVYEDGSITIKKGSKINHIFHENYAFSPKVKAFRDLSEYVGKDFVLKRDISFSSPSTAAQFVIGYSCNGWKSWRTEKKEFIETLRSNNNG